MLLIKKKDIHTRGMYILYYENYSFTGESFGVTLEALVSVAELSWLLVSVVEPLSSEDGSLSAEEGASELTGGTSEESSEDSSDDSSGSTFTVKEAV